MPSTFESVILIDDDPIINLVQTKMITLHGFANEVICFNSTEKALEHLTHDAGSRNAQLILLDINIPIMNGFEFLEKFEELPVGVSGNIKVVMLTSSLNQNDVQKAMAFHSVIGFVNKPLDGRKLKELESIWNEKKAVS